MCIDLVLNDTNILFKSALKSFPSKKGTFKLHSYIQYYTVYMIYHICIIFVIYYRCAIHPHVLLWKNELVYVWL